MAMPQELAFLMSRRNARKITAVKPHGMGAHRVDRDIHVLEEDRESWARNTCVFGQNAHVQLKIPTASVAWYRIEGIWCGSHLIGLPFQNDFVVLVLYPQATPSCTFILRYWIMCHDPRLIKAIQLLIMIPTSRMIRGTSWNIYRNIIWLVVQ